MLSRFLTWLRSAPIADPVDRRNAPAMQVLFLVLSVSIPAIWAYHLSYAGMPRGGEVSLAMAMAIAAITVVCVTMIRRGHFRAAIRLYLISLLTSHEIEYLHSGFRLLGANQLDSFMALIIGGLVLGRRPLWMIFAMLQVITASGFGVDVYRAMQAGTSVTASASNVLSTVLSQLVITLVIDRTVAALRESLAESNQRGLELQREMAERERAQSQLIHAQKMEASGRLASGVAHDFSNILDVVLGFSRQRHALRDAGSDAEQAAALSDSLEGVEIAANRGVALTRKLLSFSRNDVLKIEVFDVGQTLTELHPMLRQLFPPSVRLDLQGSAVPVPVRLDRSEFELMILNIAANARDAMPDGGRFEVRVSRPSPDIVQIALSDSGHGMDEHVRQRIFEPFFSTKNAAEGTGLGLAVVHDLVKVAGGEIRVDSAPGQGAVFVIRLPAASIAPQPDEAA